MRALYGLSTTGVFMLDMFVSSVNIILIGTFLFFNCFRIKLKTKSAMSTFVFGSALIRYISLSKQNCCLANFSFPEKFLYVFLVKSKKSFKSL